MSKVGIRKGAITAPFSICKIQVTITEDNKENLRHISAREMGAPNISGGIRYLIEQYKKKDRESVKRT